MTWSSVAYDCTGELTGYLVSWELEGESLNNTVVDPSTTSYVITGLEPCTEYTVNIAAISQTGITGLNAKVIGSTGTEGMHYICFVTYFFNKANFQRS